MLLDAYMKLKGIRGESVDHKYLGKGVIQLEHVVVGDAEPETPWSKLSRAAWRVLDGEDGKGKSNKKATAAEKLANREDSVGNEDLNQVKETMSVCDGLVREKKYPGVILLLYKPNIEQFCRQLGGQGRELMQIFEKLYVIAQELMEEQRNKPVEVEEEKVKKSCAIAIRKKIDLASAALFVRYCRYKTLSAENSASNVIIPLAKIWTRKSGDPLVYKEWQFRTLSVTAFSWDSREDGTIEENVSFLADSVQMIYRPQDITGKEITGKTMSAGWDFKTNTKDGMTAFSDDAVF